MPLIRTHCLPSPYPGQRPAHLIPAVLALVLALGATLGCGPSDHLARGPAPVILISIDTLRMDHLGCYGYERPTSPALDRTLCRDGVVFEQAIATAPSTLASHASMLTGLLPARHAGSFGDKRAVLPEIETLAEALSKAGYATASFNNGGQVGALWGLAQGFDVYQSLREDRLSAVMEPALDWLASNVTDDDGGEVFLFLHTYETHHPYTPAGRDLEAVGAAPYEGQLGPGVGTRELRRINRGHLTLDDADERFVVAAYDAEIHAMDRALGEFLEKLQEAGLYDRSLIIFTSDHGEEFGEHGWMGWHSHSLYDELLRVPLIVKLPGNRHAGLRVPQQVRLTDLMPTVLDRVGLDVPGLLDGSSLLDLIEGDPEGRRWAISQMDGRHSSSIRTADWKLWNDRLFNLQQDPGEIRDVAAQHQDVAEALEKRRAQALEDAAEGREVELPPEEIERLKALGYL